MVKDRTFYRQFFSMAVILMLQNMVTISVNLADNLMLGAYSESALAGAAAVNQIQFVYQQVLMAIGEGIVVLGGQYFGRKQLLPVKRITSFAMRFALVCGLILFLGTTFFPGPLLHFFTDDAAITEQGVRYLSIIRFTYLFFAVTQILLAAMRCVGIVRIALLLSVQSLAVNCVINYILIYGKFGAPEMGIAGAAVGTLIARAAETAVCVIFFVRKNDRLRMSLSDFGKTDRQLIQDYFRVTPPMLIVNFLWGFNNAVQNAILGHMDDHAIAANSVASTLFLIVKSMAIGAASTAAYFTAKTVGEGKEEKARQYARTMQILFVGIGLFAGLVLFLIKGPVLSLYQLDAGTRDLADHFLGVLCVIVMTMSYQMPVNAGIIKGGGDTRYCMIVDLISIWGIVIPISWAMAFLVKAPATAVIWCLNADQIFKCLPAFIKVNYGHWMKKLTRQVPQETVRN